MISPRHLLTLLPLFTPLSATAAEPRGAAPATPAPPMATNLPAVQVPGAVVVPQAPAGILPVPPLTPTPAGASRHPAPRLQPLTGSAMGGRTPSAPPVLTAPPVRAAPQFPATERPSSPVPAGAVPSAPALPGQLGTITPVPVAPKAPSTPLPPDITSPLSDYSIGVGAEASEGTWTFTVRNEGPAHPEFKEAPGYFGATVKQLIRFSVGKPCATKGEWAEQLSMARSVPKLAPGQEAKVAFSMEKAHVNKGCMILAKMEGPLNDVNVSNNSSITHTKAVFLPDLIVTNWEQQGSSKWPAGASIVIKNIGNAAAGPSTFHFYCISGEPQVPCATLGEKFTSQANRDYPVPALQPGESFSVVKVVSGLMPGISVKVRWEGEIDSKKVIKESNEQNNHDSLKNYW